MPASNNLPLPSVLPFPDSLSGRDRVYLMIRAIGYTGWADWARSKGHYRQAAHQMLTGEREHPDLRQAMVDELARFGFTMQMLEAVIAEEQERLAMA